MNSIPSCAQLCWEWNSTTNPAKLRSEEEHTECRERAARILRMLRANYREGIDYHESEESGRLYPFAIVSSAEMAHLRGDR